MGVTVPGKADELKHPIELGKECKVLFKEYLGKAETSSSFFYDAFAYAYGPSGSYACGYSASPRSAVEYCNTISNEGGREEDETDPPSHSGSESSPSGTTGKDLGGCKVYAKSPVNGKLAIVWKEEPRKVAKTEKKRLAELDRKKAVAEKKRLVEEARGAEQKRRAEQNKLASAIPSIILTRSQMLA